MKKTGLLSLLLTAAILVAPFSNLTFLAHAEETGAIPEYRYQLDTDALELSFNNNNFLVGVPPTLCGFTTLRNV